MSKKSTQKENFQIEKDVPMPPPRNRVPELPLADMQVGDSFTMAASTTAEKSAVRQRLHRYQLSNKPAKFSIRTIDDETIRVFRVADAK